MWMCSITPWPSAPSSLRPSGFIRSGRWSRPAFHGAGPVWRPINCEVLTDFGFEPPLRPNTKKSAATIAIAATPDAAKAIET